jgi:hypothetical protein
MEYENGPKTTWIRPVLIAEKYASPKRIPFFGKYTSCAYFQIFGF